MKKTKETKKKKQIAPKKVSTQKANKKIINKKVERADELRKKSLKDMGRLSRIVYDWKKDVAGKNFNERKEIDDKYNKKFKKAEELEAKSYKNYYDFIQKNFTRDKEKEALKKSKNFMSKRYIDALKEMYGKE